MNQPDLHASLNAFSEKHGLRFVEHDKRYLGLYRGICIDAWQSDRSIHIYLHSPTVHFTADDVLNKSQAFAKLAESSIPVEWVQFRTLYGSGLDRQGCFVELSPERLAAISEEDFLSIPDALEPDLRAHGASTESPQCSLCGGPAGIKPIYANEIYQFACQTCFDNLRDFVPGGAVTYEIPIRWGRVVRTLVLWSAGFTLLWGLIQQSEKGVTLQALFAAPLAASAFFCRAVGRAAEGTSFALRAVTVSCILACILIGNIWGFHTAVLRQGEISWAQAIELYFTAVIPDPQGNEWWYLIGGLAGSWIGFSFLKKKNVVKYR